MAESTHSFAKLLLTYRRRSGLSQQEAARIGGIHPSDLSKIERGRRPPPRVDVIKRWIAGFELSHKEASEFIEDAGYAVAALERAEFEPLKYPTVEAAEIDE